MVFLQKFDTEKWANVDSVKLEKGKFTFKGKTGLPEVWHISMNQGQILLPLFVENAQIEVEIIPDSLDKSVIKGSPTHDLYKQYLAKNDSLSRLMDAVYADWKSQKRICILIP